jgi:hypothetical protein
MGRGSVAIGGAARSAGTTGVGAGRYYEARITLTAAISAAGVASDPVVARVIVLSLRGAALGQAGAEAAGSSLLAVGVQTDLSPQEETLAPGRAVAAEVARAEVLVVAEAGRAEVVAKATGGTAGETEAAYFLTNAVL